MAFARAFRLLRCWVCFLMSLFPVYYDFVRFLRQPMILSFIAPVGALLWCIRAQFALGSIGNIPHEVIHVCWGRLIILSVVMYCVQKQPVIAQQAAFCYEIILTNSVKSSGGVSSGFSSSFHAKGDVLFSTTLSISSISRILSRHILTLSESPF